MNFNFEFELWTSKLNLNFALKFWTKMGPAKHLLSEYLLSAPKKIYIHGAKEYSSGEFQKIRLKTVVTPLKEQKLSGKLRFGAHLF